ncbi:MAG: HlyD family secretion protein [Clostridia bacterium]|nr:HlyD family secretion protein [Clostridia bacterium]
MRLTDRSVGSIYGGVETVRRSWHYYVLILIFLTIIGTMSGCGQKPQKKAEVPKVPVELAQVKLGDISQPATVTGTVKAGKTVQVMAATPGKIQDILVNIGDKVNRGQVIAVLENSDIEARVAQARAGLEQAESQLKQAEAKAKLDQDNLEKTEFLFEQGVVSQQTLDTARLTAETSQQNLNMAKASIESAKANVKQAEIALENTYIKAPVSGEVAARLLEPGALAQGSVVTLVTSGDLKVEIAVTEQDINYLGPGQEVEVQVKAANNAVFKGKVSNVSPAADSRTRLYQVNIAIPEAPKEVKPGMAATVNYTTKQAKNAILVPKNAIINNSGEDIVYTVVNGKAKGMVVTTGIDDGQNVEIIKGLDKNAKIIVKGQDFINEGQPVKVVNGGPKS